jgi:hypothetical protein
MLTFTQYIFESSHQNHVEVDAFHGSGRRFGSFSQSFGRVKNDFMGGGIGYFTTDHKVARSYAKNGARFAKTDTPIVYHTKLRMNNVFDVDHEFHGDKLRHILPHESEHENFARGAGLLRAGVDKYDVLSKLKSGNIKLTGHQVFAGLSRGGANSDKARDHLISRGYDGLRYNGGQNMDQATKHDVYIPYKSDSITIHKRTRIVTQPKPPAASSTSEG